MPKPYHPNDKWTKRARREGYRARSVYKLRELDEKYHLFFPGMKILDIGAAPGSWLQYMSERVGKEGKLLGLDLTPIKFIADNVTTKVCDIRKIDEVEKALNEIGWDKVDLVTSDIMANATGIKEIDQWHSIELSQYVFEVAKVTLKPKGYLVMKVFQGEGFPEFIKALKDYFKKVNVNRVIATRDRSREVYVVCCDKK